ncbi:hypothetical protein [Candidatus Puniceispirillum sp.]|uniref:hypothetical protein n=1 Tax=Candidatus Puniceispirillum sp. TaxID=2026719 RepID=UPI003F69CB27
MANENTETFVYHESVQYPDEAALRAGADNLINGCIGDVSGKAVLLICEDPALGWYDDKAPAIVAKQLQEKGATVKVLPVGKPQNVPVDEIQTAINSMDEVIFFSRIGDQDRFEANNNTPHSTMSYARTANMLGGAYGRLNHHAMLMLKDAVNEVMLNADHIRVTCPQGTHLEGSPANTKAEGSEVVVSRFPMGVPQPVLASGFKGEVKLFGYLTPTGSKVYTPEFIKLDDTVSVQFDGNRITGFTGSDDIVAKINEHYNHVAEMFGLKAFNVDSWHAGIHPQMHYDDFMGNDPSRWSNTVFTSPRFLHFHTCGETPPGEICWMVLDPTVMIDGVALWEDGRLHPERFTGTNAVLDFAPELAAAFNTPCMHVGLDDAN